jgi:TPR repeat protein
MKIDNRSGGGAGNVLTFFSGLLISGLALAGPEEDLQAGIEAFDSGDLVTAMSLYRKAADEGLAEAQVRLAYILDYSEDNEEAVHWYRAAAEQGNADGQFGLGEMYVKAEGIEQDFARAIEYFELAAENGHVQATQVLVGAYTNGGLGLAPDTGRAAYWNERMSSGESNDE